MALIFNMLIRGKPCATCAHEYYYNSGKCVHCVKMYNKINKVTCARAVAMRRQIEEHQNKDKEL